MPDAIDDAVARLRGERAIDDARVAEAIARTETSLKRRGKLRVRMQIERAGIAKNVAKSATDAVFDGIDDDVLIEAALQKRLRQRDQIADDREFQRLYRFLVSQGFEHDRVIAVLSKYKRPQETPRGLSACAHPRRAFSNFSGRFAEPRLRAEARSDRGHGFICGVADALRMRER